MSLPLQLVYPALTEIRSSLFSLNASNKVFETFFYIADSTENKLECLPI
jgi:hypothetical protein